MAAVPWYYARYYQKVDSNQAMAYTGNYSTQYELRIVYKCLSVIVMRIFREPEISNMKDSVRRFGMFVPSREATVTNIVRLRSAR